MALFIEATWLSIAQTQKVAKSEADNESDHA